MSLEPTSLAEIRYECPVCVTPLFPPIFQCDNGHLLCEPCLSRLEHCGICRVSLERNRKVRNLEVERIIRMIQHPCPNEDSGCDAMLKLDRLEDHRLECKFTKFPICAKILNGNCEETTIAEYEEHTKEVHGKSFFEIGKKSFPVSYYKNLVNFRRDFYRILRFRFLFEGKPTLVIVTVRHESESDLVTWRPYVLAGRAVTEKLKCRIGISYRSAEKIVLESPIYNLQTVPADLESCFSFSFKYLQTLPDEDAGKCWVRVEISEKKKRSRE